jgi:hypothetical protein
VKIQRSTMIFRSAMVRSALQVDRQIMPRRARAASTPARVSCIVLTKGKQALSWTVSCWASAKTLSHNNRLQLAGFAAVGLGLWLCGSHVLHVTTMNYHVNIHEKGKNRTNIRRH